MMIMMMRSRCIAIVTFGLVVGCSSSFGSTTEYRGNSKRYHRAIEAESTEVAESGDTIYQRRMADLIRRSHLVHTDSLARLTVALTKGSVEARRRVNEAMLCETNLQLRLFGPAAFLRATARMNDSLARTGFDLELTSNESQSDLGQTMEVGNQPCFREADALPEIPDSLKQSVGPTRFMNPASSKP